MDVLDLIEDYEHELTFAGDGVDSWDYDLTINGKTARLETYDLLSLANNLIALGQQIKKDLEPWTGT